MTNCNLSTFPNSPYFGICPNSGFVMYFQPFIVTECDTATFLPQHHEQRYDRESPWKIVSRQSISTSPNQSEKAVVQNQNINLEQVNIGNISLELSKLKHELVDRQVQRTKKIKKSLDPKTYSQNSKRNFFSNIARLIINFLNSEEKSAEFLEKIGTKQDQKKQFYKYIKKFKRNLDTYIKRSTLYTLLGFEQKKQPQSENIKICLQLRRNQTQNELRFKRKVRLLTLHYLKELSVPIILRSKRMNIENRQEHLALRRQLIQTFQSCKFD